MIGLLVACKNAPHDLPIPTPMADSVSIPPPTPTATSGPTAPFPTSPTIATEIPAAASSLPPASAPDASAAACRVLRGPIELPLRVPTALALRGETVEAILNENGHPRIVSLQATPVVLGPVPTGREYSAGDKESGFAVPCVAAGERVFCPDRTGSIHRFAWGGTEDHVVASSRSASRIGAATIADAHVALAYLASRQTSEGWVSEAWLGVDDDPPVRVSEDGSGATAVALAPRGPVVLALMIDARTALTAMHARMVSYDKTARLGEDSVVFVGGPGDRRTRAALTVPPSSGPAWSFLPIAKDVGTFGLAIVRIDDPPRVDEPIVWSMYPNGLDPAPLAAAWGGGRPSIAWVARVRPQGVEPSSARVLELGQIGPGGLFASRDVLATTGSPTDVAIAIDPFGAVWLAWVDAGGSWLERIHCR